MKAVVMEEGGSGNMVAKHKVPADYNDPLIMPGGGESYEARCLKDWVLPGEPEMKYKLDRFEWK